MWPISPNSLPPLLQLCVYRCRVAVFEWYMVCFGIQCMHLWRYMNLVLPLLRRYINSYIRVPVANFGMLVCSVLMCMSLMLLCAFHVCIHIISIAMFLRIGDLLWSLHILNWKINVVMPWVFWRYLLMNSLSYSWFLSISYVSIIHCHILAFSLIFILCCAFIAKIYSP